MSAEAPAHAPGPPRRRGFDSGRTVFLLYLAATIAFTWPVALQLPSGIAWDMGDQLLNCWIVAWGADHITRFLAGDLGAFHGYWDANIFHPHPLALAHSEHLFALAVQAVPVWVLTGNPVLCYNLLQLSTYALSGLGTWLLVRDLTGSGRAAFVAGLLYAFAPYRLAQLPHLQVLSSQWMPFAIFALRRYLDRPSPRAAAWTAAALVAQNLSNGYYLLFFGPLFAAWCAWELTVRRLWLSGRTLAGLAGIAAVTGGVTSVFVLPYLRLRALGFSERSLDEVRGYAADVYAYLTASSASIVWGSIARLFPRVEGELFPGAVAVLLAVIGVAAAVRAIGASIPATGPAVLRWLRLVPIAVLVSGITSLFVWVAVGRVRWSFGDLQVQVTRPARTLGRTLMALAVLFALSSSARRRTRAFLASAPGFTLVLLVVSVALSFGPEMRSLGRTVVTDMPYRWLYDHVPGFDGLRVPARYGMLVALWLSVLAGFGARALEQRGRLAGQLALALGIVSIAEGAAVPLPMNVAQSVKDYGRPVGRLRLGDRAAPVYAFVRTLPPTAVVAELPLGEPSLDLQYVFYSTMHWRRLVNGYSGGFPKPYLELRAALRRIEAGRPSDAWPRLVQTGTTHVVVHEGLYLPGRVNVVHDWLAASGARRLQSFRGDVVYEMPR